MPPPSTDTERSIRDRTSPSDTSKKLGDAELILTLGAREGKSGIHEIGSIDRRDVREAVKKIMEGGEDAFRRRARKYGGVDGEVKA